VLDRLRGYYAEQGFDNAQFEAVLAVQPGSLADFDRRLRAVAEFGLRAGSSQSCGGQQACGQYPAQAGRRSRVRQPSRTVDPAHFESDAERDLAEALASAQRDTVDSLEAGNYAAVLNRLSQLQGPVDVFFESVLVNADNPAVRANRLALLAS
jgi:glycyl-tRNA synthetase beta chain